MITMIIVLVRIMYWVAARRHRRSIFHTLERCDGCTNQVPVVVCGAAVVVIGGAVLVLPSLKERWTHPVVRTAPTPVGIVFALFPCLFEPSFSPRRVGLLGGSVGRSVSFLDNCFGCTSTHTHTQQTTSLSSLVLCCVFCFVFLPNCSYSRSEERKKQAPKWSRLPPKFHRAPRPQQESKSWSPLFLPAFFWTDSRNFLLPARDRVKDPAD